MPLRTKAKRLAHPFLTLRAYLRSELDVLRDFNRALKAARTQPRAELHSTAIHEAGYAVLRIALGLDIVAVSIVPDLRKGTAGYVLWGKDTATTELHVVARDAFILRHAMVYYAGAEATRQLVPTDPDPDAGANGDERKAAELIIGQIGGLTKRSGRLVFFKTDPTLHGLAADEAHQSFLRRMNLPGRLH